MHSPAIPPQQPVLSTPQSSPSPGSPTPLLGKLKEQFEKSPLADLLDQLLASVKEAGTKALARYKKFSTTQKVVGGVLLLLAVRRLTRGSKGRHNGPKTR